MQETPDTTNPNDPRRRWESLKTYLIVAACAVFFCSKGVFIKSAYGVGADPISLLALRMAYALPFFAVAGWWSSRGNARLNRRQWISILWLGFVGYYLSAVVNFAGLQFISVGLERMVLYTYPSLVLLGSVVFLRKRVPMQMVAAMLIAYLGIVVAFQGEAVEGGDTRLTLLGVGLVFTSAITYAVFVVGSGTLLTELGATRFTSHVVGASCLFVLAHFCLQEIFAETAPIPLAVHGWAVMLALFGTVVPSFLLGIGLKRAGAQRFAIIGTVGPLATVLLAWLVLGEALNWLQIAGFFLTMGGGLLVSLWK
jgi:drug/metabolite transporter (DMT)-like permease